ncbi:MAG: endonuclease III [Patescibacteria group bacterium]
MNKKVEQSEIRLRRKKIKQIIARLKKLFPNSRIALNYSSPWELFVAVVLSAQTTDKQVNIVTKDLFAKYKSLKDYLDVPLKEFQNDIKRIGLYKNKGKNIKLSAEIVYKDYKGKLPDTIAELIKLPGVGRKTANVLLGNIYGKSEGIAVDTHVKRLSKLFGLTKHNDPGRIEKDLMKIVPKRDWFLITYLLIDYGRKYCTARCKHVDCPLRDFII